MPVSHGDTVSVWGDEAFRAVLADAPVATGPQAGNG